MPCIIENRNQIDYPLPPPLRGVLLAGKSIVVNMTADQLAVACRGINKLFRITDLTNTSFDLGYTDVVQLDYATNLQIDASLGNTFRVTLTGNANLVAPINATDGQHMTLEVTQDGVGSRTLTPSEATGAFKFGTDATLAAWSLSTGANLTDLISFKYRASLQKWMVLSMMRGY